MYHFIGDDLWCCLLSTTCAQWCPPKSGRSWGESQQGFPMQNNNNWSTLFAGKGFINMRFPTTAATAQGRHLGVLTSTPQTLQTKSWSPLPLVGLWLTSTPLWTMTSQIWMIVTRLLPSFEYSNKKRRVMFCLFSKAQGKLMSLIDCN